MADRLMLITQLGILSTEAAQCGDDRAAATLQEAAQHLLDVHGDLCALERRRDKDRRRKRSEDSTESAESKESAESAESPRGFSPKPPFPNPSDTTHSTAYGRGVERNTALLSSRMGDLWPDADAFVRRREYVTWDGWLKEMLSILTGGKATEADLAQVCRDDEALERPIGTPKGLRIFIGSAIQERTNPGTQRPRVAGGVANRTFANGRDALRGLP